ncbi:MAG: cupin domain-containing protein [Burkholderiales bacterium]
MAEMERTKTRERGPLPGALYEQFLKKLADFHDRQQAGKIHIKKSDVVVQMSRQSHAEYFLATESFPTVLQDWRVFISNIKKQSGKHRHQGGLVIFVLEGSGWTICDGERYEWSAGDLILLPIKPGGVEHQHFNNEGVVTRWIAFIYLPQWQESSSELVQLEVLLDYQKKFGDQL